MKVNRLKYTKHDPRAGRPRSNPDACPRKRAQSLASTHRKRAEKRAVREEYNSRGCLKCGYSDTDVIENHHIFEVEGEKNVSISTSCSNGTSVPVFKLELAKTIPLCPTCHAELHAGKWDVTEHQYGWQVIFYAKLRRRHDAS